MNNRYFIRIWFQYNENNSFHYIDLDETTMEVSIENHSTVEFKGKRYPVSILYGNPGFIVDFEFFKDIYLSDNKKVEEYIFWEIHHENVFKI